MTCSKISSLDFNPGGWINMSQNAAAIQGSGRSPVSLNSEEAKYWEEREAAKAKALKLAAKAETAQRENYAKALKREKDREYQRRKAKQGRFEASMLSLDQHLESVSDDNDFICSWLDDNGAGRDKILRADGATTIAHALSCLTPEQRAFAEDILNGKSWNDLGITRQAFSKRMKIIEKKIRERLTPPSKTSLDY